MRAEQLLKSGSTLAVVSTTVVFPAMSVIFPVPVSMEPWECFRLGDFEIGVGDFVCEDIASLMLEGDNLRLEIERS